MSTKLVTLDQSQVAELQQAQRILHDLLPEIDDLEACGIDCSGARVIRDQLSNETRELVARFSQFEPGDATKLPR